MNSFPKFIIESVEGLGDCLIIAKCTFHKQLATIIDNVKGGGWFRFDAESKTFILYGESHDFGKATIEDITNCIKNDKVYRNSRLSGKFSNVSFAYDTGSEIIAL